jgi:hypothetical protein
MKRTTGYNSRFAKAGVSCFYDSEVLNSSFVQLMKFSAEKPRLRKAAKRCVPFVRTMKNLSHTLIFSLVILLFACGQVSDKGDVQRQKSMKVDTVIFNGDSIFNEMGFIVRLISFDSLLDKEHNSFLDFGKRTKDGLEKNYRDTLYSKVGKIDFADYNNDKIKDILVQNISDVRSNWTYNLYLTDIKNRTLKKVKGFEEIKNPKLNQDLGIIESRVNSGTNYIEFYRLLNNDSIYKYDILVYDSMDGASEKSYKQAREKMRRK